MGWRGLVIGLALASAPGCFGILSFDKDKDGLSNGEEKDLGLDPEIADFDADGMLDGDEVEAGLDPFTADTDGDRLLDGAEALNGADPMNPDTDDDGYLDGDEVTEGHDPNDDKDRIYKGRWPYYYAKDDLKKGPSDFYEMGKRFKNLTMVDQHGDDVALYDFYNSDKPVVIDISAEWCPPCNGMASWLEGGADTYGFGTIWPAGPEVIERGDVYWITILGEDYYGYPAYQGVCERWVDLYPSKEIPVLADGSYTSADYVGLGFWPTVILLDPELKVQDTGQWGDASGVLSELNSQFPD
jgi:thiol-disulfide isomerase/thioredoxin